MKKIFAIIFMVMFFILIPLLYLIAFGVIHANSVITASKILLGFSSILAFSLAVEWSIDALYINGEEKIRLARIDAVLLTPEVLKKCGFEWEDEFNHHDVDFYRNGPIHIQFPNIGGDPLYVWRDNALLEKDILGKQYEIPIKYLHELQALYLVLTSKVLNYIP